MPPDVVDAATDTTAPADAHDAAMEAAVDAELLDVPGDLAPVEDVQVLPDVEDVPAVDVPAPDVVDVVDAADASCNVCSEGTYRCSATGTLERCERMNGCATWLTFSSCRPLVGTRETCDMNACVLCGAGDAGTCAPSCTNDIECSNAGRARCVNGHCARRGWVPCTIGGNECAAVVLGSASSSCGQWTYRGMTVLACSGSEVLPCSSDVMCPPAFNGNPAWRCNVATGFCER